MVKTHFFNKNVYNLESNWKRVNLLFSRWKTPLKTRNESISKPLLWKLNPVLWKYGFSQCEVKSSCHARWEKWSMSREEKPPTDEWTAFDVSVREGHFILYSTQIDSLWCNSNLSSTVWSPIFHEYWLHCRSTALLLGKFFPSVLISLKNFNFEHLLDISNFLFYSL